MILKNLQLENIRSYTSQNINFPEGSTLLSGDIGSGKSSVLLAIEFALFGIGKGALSGNTLLRKGTDEGSVQLTFNINDQNYTIKRTLKKARDIIAQSSGYILKGDTKKEGTPQELKTEILNLLGYPQELLTKKSMIYRYTVYTPQEEMKQILQEDKETRLDTLRKVFDIDKYKKVSENSVIITRKIKEDKKLLQGKISDISEKNNLLEKGKQEKEETDKKLLELLPLANAAKEKVKEKKTLLESQETKIKELNEHKQKLESVNAKIQEKIAQNSRNNTEIENIKTELEDLKLKIEKVDENSEEKEQLQLQINEKTEKKQILAKEIEKNIGLDKIIEEKNKELLTISNQLQEKLTLRQQYEQHKIKITQINKCPTCEQEVSDNHKQNIASIEEAKIKRIDSEIEELQNKKRTVSQTLDDSKIKLEMKNQKEKQLNLLNNELKDLDLKFQMKNKEKENLINLKNEKNKLFDAKIKLKDEIKEEVGTSNQLKQTIQEKINSYSSVEEEYKRLKEDHNLLLNKERELAIKEAELRKELENNDKRISELKEEIDRKLKSKEKLEKLDKMQSWLEGYFIKLMSQMEKQVMAKVYLQFNELFQQWFNTLLEDETITARLDEEFTPIILQNGYETDISNLSGGEKTSLALSYRLALNKVINDVISTIKTKNLIILDEPTDGFSTEQLDKVRDVLEQLDTKQTILVSHESKIESYVDNIIRISKGEHVSKVSS